MEEIHCLHSGEVFRDYSLGAMVAPPTKAVAQHLQWMGIVFKSGERGWHVAFGSTDQHPVSIPSLLKNMWINCTPKFRRGLSVLDKFDRFLSSVSTNHIFSAQTWGRSRAGRVAK